MSDQGEVRVGGAAGHRAVGPEPVGKDRCRHAPASNAASGVGGQRIGIGGDKLALWSRPGKISVAYADGGRNAAALLQAFPVNLGRELQSVGIPALAAP